MSTFVVTSGSLSSKIPAHGHATVPSALDNVAVRAILRSVALVVDHGAHGVQLLSVVALRVG